MTLVRSRVRSTPPALLVGVVGVLAALCLIPVGFVVATAATTGWDVLAPLVFRPRVGELLANTIWLVLLGIPLSIVLGVGAAWLVDRTDVPLRRFWTIAFAAPLAVPSFVASYGWVSLIPSFGGLAGGTLIAVLSYSALVYLPVLASLRGLDPALEDAAAATGAHPLRVFTTVVLPQLRPAIVGGALVVGLHLLSEYGAFALIRFDTFTTAIVVQYQSTFAGPAASALGIVLALLCLVLLAGDALLRGRHRLSRVGSGVARLVQHGRLGAWRWPLVLMGAGFLALAVGVPALSVGRWFLADPTATDPGDLASALLQTIVYAAAGGVVTVAVAAPVAWLSVRYPGRMSRALEGACIVASSLPVIIVALALVTVSLRLVPALYQTPATVLMAYTIVFLPRAIVSLRAGIAQLPPVLGDVAHSLGATPLRTFARVLAPLLISAAGAAFALVALGAANELTATLLLAPNGTVTLATQFWSKASEVAYSQAAPFAALLILFSIPAVALLLRQTRRSR